MVASVSTEKVPKGQQAATTGHVRPQQSEHHAPGWFSLAPRSSETLMQLSLLGRDSVLHAPCGHYGHARPGSYAAIGIRFSVIGAHECTCWAIGSSRTCLVFKSLPDHFQSDRASVAPSDHVSAIPVPCIEPACRVAAVFYFSCSEAAWGCLPMVLVGFSPMANGDERPLMCVSATSTSSSVK